MKRYILIGGLPFRNYTGTLTYTGLKLVGQSDSLTEIGKLATRKFEEHGGLLLALDTETGEEI